MIKFSSYLANAWLGTSPLKTLLSSCKVYVYSGPVPDTADDAVDASSVLLATVDNGGSGGTFGDPANGVIKIASGESWSGTVGASGDAAFYRLCVGTDDGSAAAASGNYRVQGTIGTDASFDLVVADTSVVNSASFPIDDFELVYPQ